MSKAFTRDDASDEPLVVPPRPPLPAGVPNYVTPRGLASLREERGRLDADRTRLESHDGDPERAAAAALWQARARDLDERIAGAVVVEPGPRPREEVRFGARVTVRGATGVERHLEIVGVDEADAAHEHVARVAFVSPVARALLGARVGDVVTLKTPAGEEELEVVAIG